MILGIIGAMSEELEILLKDMELEKVEEKAKMKFHKGRLWGHDVVAVVCGIGKVNAAVCTQILVSEYNVSSKRWCCRWNRKRYLPWRCCYSRKLSSI